MNHASHSANRQRCKLAHLITELQEAAFLRKIRMLCAGDRILQVGMICQSHMKAGNTRLFQKWYKDLQLFLQYAGVAVMGILLTDCQLIINGVIRQLGADGGNRFYGKSSPPFRASAIGVCTKLAELKLPHIRSPCTCTISNPAFWASTAASPNAAVIFLIL
mgnify:CR=1 FL=1